ncbi:hypothetical protein SCUCBS95973_004239 [Sporothrix curviconia]|uniref:Spindle pole body component n=1 Tax=Sporothrix curviconia TaxID=1260050 RepID=A0ABP0BNP2_9PEZI
MAFLAQLTAQTEELVTALTSLTPGNDPSTFAALREATLKSLRHHSNLRTNQFEVESRLDGLAERFSVAGRDELSDALRDRRTVLAEGHDADGEPLTTKWTPDILDFLLELSDRPTGQPNLLDNLGALIESRKVHEPPPLRWEDISREDGWGSEMDEDDDDDDDGEDDDVYDYGFYGDGDQHDEDDDTTMSTMSSVGAIDDDRARAYRDLRATDEHTRGELASLLTAVRDSQAWRTEVPKLAPLSSETPKGAEEEDGKVLVSELQILREVLFMLQGLETTLFGHDCVPVKRFQLSDVTSAMHTSLLEAVAESGRKLQPLRRRAQSRNNSPPVPLLQVFQDAIRQRLHAFDQEVTQIQTRFVDDSRQRATVVSITAILDELQSSLRNLFALAAIVQTLDVAERSHAHAFRYLEVLFDATSVAQYAGDDAVYAFLGTLFFECFQVYLRPIRAWMEAGVLDKNDKVFFVSGATTSGASVPLNQIWHSQYKLLRTSTGALHAPSFLQPAASKIFTTGKSIVVLQQLGKYNRHRRHNAPEPALDFATVCPPDMAMAPFAQLFGDAFERWIQSKHHAASATLQSTLFDACGLWASLEALHRVYLFADGAAVDEFATRVFHGLDSRNARWLDRYTMTEMAREAFSEALGGDHGASRLSVTVDKRGLRPDSDDPAVARRSVRDGLARIRPRYRLAWPVQIIIPADTITRGYQAVFTLLLQIRRANSVLSRHRLLDDTSRGEQDVSGPLFFSLRSRLLWFCNTLQSYLATLVIAPSAEALRASLQSRAGADVDAMIAVHDQFVRALVDEALLGTKLQPLHAAVLDLLDLALRLEDAHRHQAARTTSALQETWRLSVLSVPSAASPRTPRQAAKQRVLNPKGGGGGADSVRRTLFLASPQRGRRAKERQLDGNGDGDDDNDGTGEHVRDRDNDDDDDDDSYDYNYDNNDYNDGDDSGGSKKKGEETSYKDTLLAIRGDLDSTLRFLAGGLRGVARASRNATAAAKWDMLAEMLGDDGSGRTERSRFGQ